MKTKYYNIILPVILIAFTAFNISYMEMHRDQNFSNQTLINIQEAFAETCEQSSTSQNGWADIIYCEGEWIQITELCWMHVYDEGYKTLCRLGIPGTCYESWCCSSGDLDCS